MSTAIEESPVFGQEPSAEELELVAWAEDARKKGLETIRESLRHLVTLTTALLAGSAVLFAQPVVPVAFKAAGAVCLMLSLAVALYGSLPREVGIDPRCPDDVREARDRGSRDRMRALQLSSLSLFVAFLVVFLGLAYSAVAG